MTDWTKDLSPEGRDAYDEYVEHFRRETVEKIAMSSAFVSLTPSDGKGDVKFWTELGCAIMNDKPILAIVMPGAPIPDKLTMIADEIIMADIDTEDGQRQVAKAIRRLTERA
jgi:hypothetical protein